MPKLDYFKKHPLFGKLSLLFVTLFILLLFAEIVFRVKSNYNGYNERNGRSYNSVYSSPNGQGWYHVYPPHSIRKDDDTEFSYSFKANNEGLLDKDFTIAKDSNTIRLMIFGDSFIQGIGTPYDSSCPHQLGQLLNQIPNSQKKIDVWNCGVGNSDPFYEYVLMEKLLKYHPDYIVVALNATDINDVTIRGGFERFKPDSTVVYHSGPWFEPLYAHSYLVRNIVQGLLKYDWMLQSPSKQEPAKQHSIALIKNVLTDFDSVCKALHVPLLVVFQPCRWDFNTQGEYAMQPFIQFCDSAKIPEKDLKSYLESLGYSGDKLNPIYWPVDGHFNNKGYALYAQFMKQALLPVLDSIQGITTPR
jgi:hypothetical protein